MNLKSKEKEQFRTKLVWWNDNSQSRSYPFSQDGYQQWRSLNSRNASHDRLWQKETRQMATITKKALIIVAIIVFLLVLILCFVD
jgi:hypothetical protein